MISPQGICVASCHLLLCAHWQLYYTHADSRSRELYSGVYGHTWAVVGKIQEAKRRGRGARAGRRRVRKGPGQKRNRAGKGQKRW